MAVGELMWLAAGALISFGLVGFLTGLVLVPFGIALAVSATRAYPRGWSWLEVGAGLGPVALLGDDVTATQPPAGTVGGFWIGTGLLAVGLILSAYLRWRTPDRARQ
jgi:hypothetical protein